MSETIVAINHLNKLYGKESALADFSMNVQRGDIYGFVGQNGSGKTTTMKYILSLIEGNSGSLELFGKNTPADLANYIERIGSLIESPSFYPYLSAHENLTYYAKFKGITDKEIVGQLLEKIGLDDAGRKKFKNFSLGMKQRLALGLAIMNNPDLLILDEPFNGLDPQGLAEFRKILLKLNHESNVTILISSHILDELSHIATTYGFIHQGKMIEEISEPALQKKCGKYLLLKVDDTKKASFVLEQTIHTENYQILDDQRIRLFDCINESQRVISALVKNGVEVKEVERKGLSLESYYLNLTEGGNQNVKHS